MAWTKPYRSPQNQRLDPLLYTHPEQVYFLTLRAYSDQAPFLREELSKLAIGTLLDGQLRWECTIFTYCLMPDHLHFLISPVRSGISVLTFADRYKGKTTNGSWAIGWQGKLWQPRYYDHIVRRDEDLRAIAEYIAGNPVRKNLVGDVADWPWTGSPNPLPL